MVEYESVELTSCHGHIKNTSTHVTVLTENINNLYKQKDTCIIKVVRKIHSESDGGKVINQDPCFWRELKEKVRLHWQRPYMGGELFKPHIGCHSLRSDKENASSLMQINLPTMFSSLVL